jgi:phytoene dehydrogenase-like protein
MEMTYAEYDAVIVGAGPNGLAAAITLQRSGLSVIVLEAKPTIGGGLRTEELTLPGFHHDVCSAIHPMAVASPFLQSLPLERFGLEYIHPPVCVAHPLDRNDAALLYHSLNHTATLLEKDSNAYYQLYDPLVRHWPDIAADALGPLSIPHHPLRMAQFGLHAISPATILSKKFETKRAKALWAGIAAHAITPLSSVASSAIGLVLTIAAHTYGFPLPKGGSISIAHAMAGYFESLGGKIETNTSIQKLSQLPSSRAVLFDISPRRLLEIAGHRFSNTYRRQLSRYRYGPGVFKMDWALDAPIPFTNEGCRQAGTVHIGGTLEEITFSEHQAWHGRHTDKPFVLLAQQSLFDPTRAPEGKHTAYAYCHTPNGSTRDYTEIIEAQIEHYAPGFRERILARHSMDTAALETYNANYIGGDIIGGAADIRQLFTRPALRSSPYRTSAKGLYLCSASTPPGGGVHGLCGFHAAKRVLKDLFPGKA